MRRVIVGLLRMSIALPLTLVLLGGFAAWLLSDFLRPERQRIGARRMRIAPSEHDVIVSQDVQLDAATPLSWTAPEQAHVAAPGT